MPAARNPYARAAARGFPVIDIGGQSGQGTQPDSTRPGTTVPGEPSGESWSNPYADPGSVVTALAPPADFVSGGLWGLSGSMNPDRTPKSEPEYISPSEMAPRGNTHAAPIADPTLPVGEYFAEADAAHAYSAGGPEERRNVGTITGMAVDHVTAEGGSASGQQPLTGPMRALGGLDAVQGYGGGADGPGGVNGSMPVITDQKSYPGSFYAADAFVNAREVTAEYADALQFIPNEPSMAPWTGGLFSAPTTTVHEQDPLAADVPAQGTPLSAGVPAYLTSFWA